MRGDTLQHGPGSKGLAVAARTHPGRVRTRNEDAYGYSLGGGAFAVCDGMGGAAGGELASMLAASLVLERLGDPAPAPAPARRLEKTICAANRLIHARAARDPGLHGMGTTVVCLLLAAGEPRAWVAHVGDSRAYLYRGGRLQRCTHDHSLVEEQVRLGQLTAAEAARSPMRHVITRAVGIHRAVQAELTELATEPGDLFLLCSDGLTRELSEAEIAARLGELEEGEELTGACEALVDGALAAGGADNITCLLVRVSQRPSSPQVPQETTVGA